MVTSTAEVVQPPDVAGVVDVLRAAAGSGPGRTVTIRGAGTKVAWGGSLSPVDIVLSTTRLTGVVSHEPGDRVVTVRAGTPLRSLSEVLAASGQRLCIESGYVDATVGGVLASGEAGPLRARYGSARDLLIGVEFVRADGVVAHSGGRVVKNVAGYDLGRLLGGSYGTVGVITQATFRLHPLPVASAWVVASEIGLAAQPDMAAVVPAAVEYDWPGSGSAGSLAVLVEGSRAGVAARAQGLQSLLRGTAGGAEVELAAEPPPWWGHYPFGDGEVGLKIASPVSLVPAVLASLRERFGDRVAVRGSLGSGVLHAGLPSTVEVAGLANALGHIRTLLHDSGGSCVVVTAPPSLKDSLDLWGEVPGLPLMRRLKEQFDPAGRFAAGRFVGGL